MIAKIVAATVGVVTLVAFALAAAAFIETTYADRASVKADRAADRAAVEAHITLAGSVMESVQSNVVRLTQEIELGGLQRRLWAFEAQYGIPGVGCVRPPPAPPTPPLIVRECRELEADIQRRAARMRR